jgi:hypothetical protein
MVMPTWTTVILHAEKVGVLLLITRVSSGKLGHGYVKLHQIVSIKSIEIDEVKVTSAI